MNINKIGVLGAGIMGQGIAQICAEAGYATVVVDIAPAVLEKCQKGIEKAWQKAVAKGKINDNDHLEFKGRIAFGTDLESFKDCDVVIEAVLENMSIKKTVFQQLDEICPEDTIFATNTSALSITEIAASTNRSSRVVGMHFFNPVPAMKLIEIIPATETSEEVVRVAMDLAVSLGKEPIRVKESPGFVVNRILAPYMIEAYFVLQEGLASAEDIDKAMKLGAGMPMGPLELADLVGLDISLNVAEYLFNEFGDSKYRPATILKQKVRAGHLGIKAGKGFHNY